MSPSRIYTLGEIVYDIILEDAQIKAGTPGGAMLNTAISLGRLGFPVSLISELGQDALGNLIMNFLEKNNVDRQYIARHKELTSISFAVLDKMKNASFQFYKYPPQESLMQELPKPRSGDLLFFGSFFSLQDRVFPHLFPFLEESRKKGACICFDPNIRRPHKEDMPNMQDKLHSLFSLTHIVRASHEDFETMFDISSGPQAYQLVQQYSDAILIYTTGGQSVKLFSKDLTLTLPVPALNPVSTIGAGDTFNAGLMSALYKMKISATDLPSLEKKDWIPILESGVSMAQMTCMSTENYIPVSK